MPPREPRSLQRSAHVLLLKGLLLLAAGGVAFLLAWRYGLLARVWHADPTGISAAITLVLLAAGTHGSIALLRRWRALRHLARLQRQAAAGAVGAAALPEGCVRRYVRDLHAKASLSGPHMVDRALLLETLEAELRQDRLFGGFVADLLLSLGLLGTVIGLVVMLGPIGGAAGPSAAEGALALSGGMAVVLYTTLAGLIGGALLKLQGVVLDRAVDELVRRTASLTEAQLLPTIQRTRSDAAV